MRGLVQRVQRAKVSVGGETVGEIGAGVLLLVGVTHSDTAADAEKLADKVWSLRIFADDDGVMNRSLADTSQAVLVVSQFTLYGDTRRGRRSARARGRHGVEDHDHGRGRVRVGVRCRGGADRDRERRHAEVRLNRLRALTLLDRPTRPQARRSQHGPTARRCPRLVGYSLLPGRLLRRGLSLRFLRTRTTFLCG